MISAISPQDTILKLVNVPQSVKAIDVRSEGEFFQGALPGFKNLPLLTDRERHEVGLCFKTSGQGAAIDLGLKITSPHRDERVENWIQHLKKAEYPIVTCWRGGLRSKVASQWIEEKKLNPLRVEGGYKALRRELLKTLDAPRKLLVLAGPTGSGKTALLKEVTLPKVDLENLAAHRGSAFGKIINTPQPRQANFENSLALEFLKLNQEQILIEDESINIGQIYLPLSLKEKISKEEVVKIKLSMEERLKFLFREYIQEPLSSGVSDQSLRLFYEEALSKIKSKLGSLLATTLLAEMHQAFQLNDQDLHHKWIRSLLENYYDKMYDYSFSKYSRKVLYEGDWHQCKNWIQKRFA